MRHFPGMISFVIRDFLHRLLALAWASHDVNSENATLMPGEQIIDKVADDRIRLVPKLGHYPADQCAAPSVPFQVDCAVKIARTVNFRPTVRPVGLFCPDFNETEFLFQLRISHDLAAQRSASGRDHMDHGLHL